VAIVWAGASDKKRHMADVNCQSGDKIRHIGIRLMGDTPIPQKSYPIRENAMDSMG